MNSFDDQGLDESAFGDKGLSGLRTFDAFRKLPGGDERRFHTSESRLHHNTQLFGDLTRTR